MRSKPSATNPNPPLVAALELAILAKPPVAAAAMELALANPPNPPMINIHMKGSHKQIN